ncbi:EF-hand domain-containing protein [Geobacter benzoatilyticus]|uniref:EF-hand domain-containing protein n=1 Tax=Geobacter benzoatilyticus TaxID=2815309 RepID=A0ABX7Q5H9_9BACT|nr:EF-hand domain-containing protein [Geobacter benzoatilyticus]QSV46707.1 EF-hand domain-containing protein [Geobacter benzoatilyticus]
MTSSIGGIGGGVSAALLQRMQEEMFKTADANGDGTISKDELGQVAKSGENQDGTNVDTLFSQLDSDSDGAISRLESDAAIARLGQQMQSQGMPPQGPPPGPPPGERANSSSDSSESSTEASAIFDAMDTNQDGTVSLEELTAALEKAKNSSASASGPESLLDNLAAALQSGDISAAKEELAALQEDLSAHNGGRSDDPFSKDLQTLSEALESGSLEDARSIVAGIQDKLSSRPPHGPAPEQSQDQDGSSRDAVAATLQSVIDALEKSSSSTSDTITAGTLKSIFTEALASYRQQSAGSYAQDSGDSAVLSATA